MNALKRLEQWSCGHKARSVCVERDNGYGASCWLVKLFHENGHTIAEEVFFFTYPEEKGGETAYKESAMQNGVVSAKTADDEEDWPGLEKTIHCAIDAFEAGICGKNS